MEHTEKYYQRLVSAMIRGELSGLYPENELFTKHLDYLTEQEHESLVALGNQHELKTNFFQRVAPLAETKKVLDILRGISPDNILDIGSGRGAFIWRLLDEYKNLSITAVDHSEEQTQAIQAVIKGGVVNLKAKHLDAVDMSAFPSEVFDVTTALRVLEYIEDVSLAISEICRVTKRFILVLFPAHPDNNPEKKHVFTQEKLKALFHENDVLQVRFEMMSNYHLVIARK